MTDNTMCSMKSDYATKLNLIDTQVAIKLCKDTFERKLAEKLNILRVSAPLFVPADSGLNDNLNGVERPVAFDVKESGMVAEIVHSLAKWKRHALASYGFTSGTGLYTDMNAIRRDETADCLHSIYVDQWDWEKVITESERNLDTLKATVRDIYTALLETEATLHEAFPCLTPYLAKEIHFFTSQELEDLYPDVSPSQRETKIAQKYGSVFVMQIGCRLNSGKKHDNRAPDYDDWSLNGDMLVYYPVLERAVEISSMGIRVNKASMLSQLESENALGRLNLPFHKALMEDKLPLSMGGGLGQSRICMLLLQKAHIGEVQASLWPEDVIRDCKEKNVFLL